jgi:hypothetical protein
MTLQVRDRDKVMEPYSPVHLLIRLPSGNVFYTELGHLACQQGVPATVITTPARPVPNPMVAHLCCAKTLRTA